MLGLGLEFYLENHFDRTVVADSIVLTFDKSLTGCDVAFGLIKLV
jgi:hypothetical protein